MFDEVIDEAIKHATVNPDGLHFYKVKFLGDPEAIHLRQIEDTPNDNS